MVNAESDMKIRTHYSDTPSIYTFFRAGLGFILFLLIYLLAIVVIYSKGGGGGGKNNYKWAVRKVSDEEREQGKENECTICLENNCDSCTTCKHWFHFDCISQWDTPTCPVCRHNIGRPNPPRCPRPFDPSPLPPPVHGRPRSRRIQPPTTNRRRGSTSVINRRRGITNQQLRRPLIFDYIDHRHDQERRRRMRDRQIFAGDIVFQLRRSPSPPPVEDEWWTLYDEVY